MRLLNVRPDPARPLAPRGTSPRTVITSRAVERFCSGRLSEADERLLGDAADGRWDEHSLLEAALLAGGVDDPARIERCLRKLDDLAEELRATGRVAGSSEHKARAVFDFLHARVLTGGYRLEASDVAVTLEEGRFNCVTASVLFNCLAARFELDARGLEIPGHAMSRLVLPNRTLDVETTCPGWFRLLDDPGKQADLVRRTLGDELGGGRARPREVSDVQFVATIYYNRGVDLLAEGRFDEAAAANAKALTLDPENTTAWGNLLATINNWSIDRAAAGQYARAVELLETGLGLDDAYEVFHTNYLHVHLQWADACCRDGRYGEALTRLDGAARAGAGREDDFAKAKLDVYRRWGREQLAAGDLDAALAVFDRAGRELSDPPSVAKAEIAELNRHVVTLLDAGQAAEAVAVLDRAVARHPDAGVLAENRRVALMRWAMPAFESGEYPEAIRRTTHGGAPGQLDEDLLGNVRYGYYHWMAKLLADGRRIAARRVARQARSDPFLQGRTDGVIPPGL